jgi:hypothetical protein
MDVGTLPTTIVPGGQLDNCNTVACVVTKIDTTATDPSGGVGNQRRSGEGLRLMNERRSE